jgi:signal transduction histidine kinase
LEVIDTILHNIGNAINNVTIGIGTIQERLANGKLTRYLLSLANAIKEHQDNFADYIKNDPQGQKVAPFIIALADDFVKQDEELAKIVSRVRNRAEHIASIVRTEKMLGKNNVYSKKINLRKIVDDSITILQDSIIKRNIEIIVDCDTAPEEIATQESQFHQMLVNLIKNSIEAIDEHVPEGLSDTPFAKFTLERSEGLEGRPFIKIRFYIESNSLILEVTDNGIGIEKDKLDVIFRPGYTTKSSGSGLGLHSTANFVNGCNGKIFALSDGIGKGTTMRIELPISSIAP